MIVIHVENQGYIFDWNKAHQVMIYANSANKAKRFDTTEQAAKFVIKHKLVDETVVIINGE